MPPIRLRLVPPQSLSPQGLCPLPPPLRRRPWHRRHLHRLLRRLLRRLPLHRPLQHRSQLVESLCFLHASHLHLAPKAYPWKSLNW